MRPHHVQKVLLSTEELKQRCARLVDEMAGELVGDNVIIVGLLRGSFIFLADLVRELYRHEIHPRIDFMTLESYYDGDVSSGHVHVAKDCAIDVKGARVLVVDDILDSGRTLTLARDHLWAKKAASVHTCVLLDKPSRRKVPAHADFVGFTVEDLFVVGYGLDYAGLYRELPYISHVTFTDE